MAGKVKPNDKRVKKLIKQLVNEGFLIPHKKEETVSLNSAKSEEIIEYIKRFLKKVLIVILSCISKIKVSEKEFIIV
jgi:glutamate-1-semialdehyde aminotransferase